MQIDFSKDSQDLKWILLKCAIALILIIGIGAVIIYFKQPTPVQQAIVASSKSNPYEQASADMLKVSEIIENARAHQLNDITKITLEYNRSVATVVSQAMLDAQAAQLMREPFTEKSKMIEYIDELLKFLRDEFEHKRGSAQSRLILHECEPLLIQTRSFIASL